MYKRMMQRSNEFKLRLHWRGRGVEDGFDAAAESSPSHAAVCGPCKRQEADVVVWHWPVGIGGKW